MKYTISPDRSKLTFTVDASERKILRELPTEGDENIQTDDAMWDWFEHVICNSELTWISPSETGDLTSAPMIGILGEEIPYCREHDRTPHRITGPNLIQEIESRWAFPDYCFRSVLEDLRDKGECVFIGGDL